MKKRSKLKRPAKAKKSAKGKRKPRKTAKRKPAAKPKPTLKAKAQSAGATSKVAPPVGPKLRGHEKGVHIMLVRDEAVACVTHAHPSASELQQVAAHLGKTPAMTDVVVFGGRPYHFAGGKLRDHPQVHKDFPATILVLYRSTRDTAVWWSEQQFSIAGIQKEHPQNADTADYPFDETPVTGREGGLFVARSAVPKATAYGQQYKIMFTMDGRTIDPNMDCNGG